MKVVVMMKAMMHDDVKEALLHNDSNFPITDVRLNGVKKVGIPSQKRRCCPPGPPPVGAVRRGRGGIET